MIYSVWAMHEYNLLQNKCQAIGVTFIQKHYKFVGVGTIKCRCKVIATDYYTCIQVPVLHVVHG